MQKEIISLLILGSILVLPTQYVHAEGWNWKSGLSDITKSFETITEPITRSTEVSELLWELPLSLPKYHDGILENEVLLNLGAKLLYVKSTLPDEFNFLIEMHSEILLLLDDYTLYKKSILLNSIQVDSSNNIKYITEITIPLQQIAIDYMMIQIAYAENLEDIDSKQEFTKKIGFDLMDKVHTVDPQSERKISLGEHLNMLLPGLTYEQMLFLVIDTEYIFSIPIVLHDDRLISIDELCQIEIDKQQCDLLKKYAVLAHKAAKKDPDAALEIAKIVLEIALDVNYKTNAGYDDELLFALYYADKSSEELLDEKMFRVDGNMVSLNDLTNLQCSDANISITEQMINGYNFKKQNITEMQSEYNEVINILQNIDEDSCSISLVK